MKNLLLILALAVPSVALGQAPQTAKQNGEPSLKATLDGLQEKLHSAMFQFVAAFTGEPTDVSIWSSIKPGSPDSCKITVIQGETRRSQRHVSGGADSSTFTYKVPLADDGLTAAVQPVAYNNSHELIYKFSMGTTTNVIALEISSMSRTFKTDHTNQYVNKFFLFFRDESTARHVLDAFVHAADLCRKANPATPTPPSR